MRNIMIFIVAILSIIPYACVSNKKLRLHESETNSKIARINESLKILQTANNNMAKLLTELSNRQVNNEQNLQQLISELDNQISQSNYKIRHIESQMGRLNKRVDSIDNKLILIEKIKDEESFFKNEINDLLLSFEHIDSYIIRLETPHDISKAELVELIVKPAKTDLEKARAIFMWLASNISYDTDYKIYDADNCFTYRKGVCDAYSSLCSEFCDLAGLESRKIIGYAKDVNYDFSNPLKETNHAWNAIKIDNNWILLDATWGAGYVNNNLFTREIKHWWFNPDPALFVFSHFPENDKMQMLDTPLDLKTFWSLPPVMPNTGLMGFNGIELLKYFLNNPNIGFPKMYSFQGMFNVVKMPVRKELNSKETYDFEFVLPDNTEIALINNGKWYKEFQKTDNNYFINLNPSSGTLKVSIAYNGGINYHTVFEYMVQ